MTIRWIVISSAGALIASTTGSQAGPCFNQIYHMEERVEVFIKRKAVTGPPARQSSEALLHHQPTANSITATELGLSVLSPEAVDTVRQGMARAREADRNGDLAGCEHALSDVQSAIGSLK